jgi:hypothetical protein
VRNIKSITKEVYKEFLIDKVIPAIKSKWPIKSETICIQQDNAKPHIDGDDPEFVAVARADGWNIQLMNQPARSPDVFRIFCFNSGSTVQRGNRVNFIEGNNSMRTVLSNKIMLS